MDLWCLGLTGSMLTVFRYGFWIGMGLGKLVLWTMLGRSVRFGLLGSLRGRWIIGCRRCWWGPGMLHFMSRQMLYPLSIDPSSLTLFVKAPSFSFSSHNEWHTTGLLGQWRQKIKDYWIMMMMRKLNLSIAKY